MSVINNTYDPNSLDIRTLGSNLELLAQQVVEGFIVGLHKSPFHGFSVEFAEHKLYNPGESTRSIDWKVYGRTDRLYTKKYDEETNLRCHIVIDASSTMYFPFDEKNKEKTRYTNKLSFSAQAAAVLIHAMKQQRDAFGLTIFEEDIKSTTKEKSSTVHKTMIFNQLTQIIENQVLNKKTDLAKSLHQVAELIHKRSVVIIFSDGLENSGDGEKIFDALQHLKFNKHEVIFFHVADKAKELDFEFENRPYIFVDMESGEEVRLQPNQVKEYYKEQVNKFTEKLKLKCLQFNIDFVEADINKGFHQILQTWMAKRSKMS
jgi:uncharacterized protein (DUF58 family)